MSKAKAKGTAAETMLVRYLQANGFPYVERRALGGSQDRGDIAGVPGCVLEVKSGARLALPEWLRETEQERLNAGVPTGILVVKLRGMGEARVGDWPAILPISKLLQLMGVQTEHGEQASL
jgi:hypothetical protein